MRPNINSSSLLFVNGFCGILIILISIDVYSQYTPLSIFGNIIKFILVLFFSIYANWLIKIRMRKHDVLLFLFMALSLVLNYNDSYFSVKDYFKVSLYYLIYIFAYFIIMNGVVRQPLLSVLLIKAAFWFSFANAMFRALLSYLEIVPEWNYNWSAFLLVSLYIILRRGRANFLLGLILLSFVALILQSRGVFLAGISYVLIVLLYRINIIKSGFFSGLLPHIFSTLILAVPLAIVLTIEWGLNEQGRLELELIGKSGGLSGRELGYALFFDKLSTLGGISNVLIFGGGATSLYVDAGVGHIDDYAHIYGAGLQFMLFFGVPLSYLFFWRIGKHIAESRINAESKWALVGYTLIVANAYSALSLMHFSLGFLVLLICYQAQPLLCKSSIRVV